MTYELPITVIGGSNVASAEEHNTAIVNYVESRIAAWVNAEVPPDTAAGMLIAGQRHFNSRADAIAADLPAPASTVRVAHNGRVFTYYRITANTDLAALPTNGGTVFWAPFAVNGAHDPAAWGDGYEALWKCWEWQKAVFGQINMTMAAGDQYTQPTTGTAASQRLVANGIPVRWNGNNARIYQTTIEPIAAIAPGFDRVDVVTSFATATETISEDPGEVEGEEDEDSDASDVTRIGLSALAIAEYEQGDVIFIRDDRFTPLDVNGDPVVDGGGALVTPGMPAHKLRRRGEFAVVAEVNRQTNQLVIYQPMRFTYSTSANCKIGRVRRAQVTVENLRIETTTDIRPGLVARNDIIYIANASRPVVRGITSPFFGGHLVHFYGCHEPNSRDCAAWSGTDHSVAWETTAGGVATKYTVGRYMIRNTNCTGGIHIGHSASQCRHLIDFLASNSVGPDYVNDSISNQLNGAGACFSATVSDCNVTGSSGAAFCTHDATSGVVFNNCVSRSPRRTSFGLRGRGNILRNCRSENARVDVRVFIHNRYESTGAVVSDRHLIENFTSDNVRGVFIRCDQGVDQVIVNGVTMRVSDDFTGSATYVARCDTAMTLTIDNLHYDALNGSALDAIFFFPDIAAGETARVSLFDSQLVTRDNGLSVPALIEANGAGDIQYSIDDVRAWDGPSQGQLFDAIKIGTAGTVVGSHMRKSRVVGLWSEDVPAASRAEVLSAYVSTDLQTLSYVQGEALIQFRKDPASTAPAMTLADGTVWSPLRASTPEHFGAVGDGVANDTAALTAWGERGGIMIAEGRYLVAAAGANAGGVLCRLLNSVDVTCGPNAQFIAGQDLDADIIRFTAQLSEYSAGRVYNIRWRGGYFNQQGQLPGAILPNSATWPPVRAQGTGPTDGLYILGWVLDGATYYSGANMVEVTGATFYGGPHWQAADAGGDSGIFIAGAKQQIVKNNLFIGLRDLGVYPSGFPSGQISDCSLVVSENRFVACHWGVAPKRQMKDVIITGNDFENTPQCIILSGLTGTEGTGGLVSGNIARRAWQVVRVDDESGIQVSDNHSLEHGCVLADGVTLPASVFTSRNCVVDLRGAEDCHVRGNVLHSIHPSAVTAGWTMHAVRLREGEFAGARISQRNLVTDNVAKVGSGAVVEESGFADFNRFSGNRAPVAVAAVTLAGAGSVNEDAPVVSNQTSTTHTGTTDTTDLRTQTIGAGFAPRIGDKLTVMASGTFAGTGTKRLLLVIGGGTMSFAASADGTSPAWNLIVHIVNNGTSSRADGVLTVGGETLQVQNTNPTANGAVGYDVILRGDLSNAAGSITVDGWRIESDAKGIAA